MMTRVYVSRATRDAIADLGLASCEIPASWDLRWWTVERQPVLRRWLTGFSIGDVFRGRIGGHDVRLAILARISYGRYRGASTHPFPCVAVRLPDANLPRVWVASKLWRRGDATFDARFKVVTDSPQTNPDAWLTADVQAFLLQRTDRHWHVVLDRDWIFITRSHQVNDVLGFVRSAMKLASLVAGSAPHGAADTADEDPPVDPYLTRPWLAVAGLVCWAIASVPLVWAALMAALFFSPARSAVGSVIETIPGALAVGVGLVVLGVLLRWPILHAGRRRSGAPVH